MVNFSSLEVRRRAFIESPEFFDCLETSARQVFDQEGEGLFVEAPLTPVRLAIRRGAVCFDDQRTYYTHGLVTSAQKHLRKKLERVREYLEEGMPTERAEAAHKPMLAEPLADIFDEIAITEYHLPGARQLEVAVDDVTTIPHPTQQHTTLFCLLPNPVSDEGELLARQDDVTHEFMTSSLKALSKMSVANLVGKIPVAETRDIDGQKHDMFMKYIRETLPITVSLGPVEYASKY